MSGFLDGINYDSDEDFEETAGRGDGGRADPAGDGGRERGRGVGVGRGLGGRAAVGRGRGGAPGHEGGGGVGRGRGGGAANEGPTELGVRGGDMPSAIIQGFSQVAGPSVVRVGGQAGRGGGAGQGRSDGGRMGGDDHLGVAGQGDHVDEQFGGVGRGEGGRGGVAHAGRGRGGGQAGRGRARGGGGGGQGGRRAKFRNWVVTINNYTGVPDAEFLKGPPPIKYLCFGKEVSSTGTPHLQMYVSFVNAVAQPSQYFRRFGSGHFIPANGTAEQNAEYCSKEGDFTELGRRPLSHGEKGELGGQLGGQRGGDMEQARWQMTWDLAKQGRIEEIPADIRIRHYSTINKIAAKYQKPPPKLSELDNLWLVGPAGTGKSTFVHDKYPGGYKKSMTKWWCGYNVDDEGHSTVILDDLHPRWSEKELLKNWADVFSFVAETKGGSMQIRPQRIVVTSNYTIEQVLLFRKPFCPQTGERIASLSSARLDMAKDTWNFM